jgi:hypothetical protein
MALGDSKDGMKKILAKKISIFLIFMKKKIECPKRRVPPRETLLKSKTRSKFYIFIHKVFFLLYTH